MRIARIVVTGICLAGLSAPALAQPSAGVLFGVGGAKVSPAPPGGTTGMTSSFTVGGYVALPLTKTIDFMPEIAWDRKGSGFTERSQESTVTLDYIDLNLLARMGLFKSFYMTEGVTIGFPARAQFKSGSSTQDIKDDLTNPEIATVVGGGVRVADGRAGIEFRYTGGIRRVDKTKGADVFRNRSFVGMVRIKL